MIKNRPETKMRYMESSEKVILWANELFIPISGVRECYYLSWDLLGINVKHSLSIVNTELIGYQNLTKMKYSILK